MSFRRLFHQVLYLLIRGAYRFNINLLLWYFCIYCNKKPFYSRAYILVTIFACTSVFPVGRSFPWAFQELLSLSPDLLGPYCYHSVKAPNPTLPVFAFLGQETVWTLRSKTCSHPLSRSGETQDRWTKLLRSRWRGEKKNVYFNMQENGKEENLCVATASNWQQLWPQWVEKKRDCGVWRNQSEKSFLNSRGLSVIESELRVYLLTGGKTSSNKQGRVV